MRLVGMLAVVSTMAGYPARGSPSDGSSGTSPIVWVEAGAPDGASVTAMSVDGFSIPLTLALPSALFAGKPLCLTLYVPLEGVPDRTTACLVLSVKGGAVEAGNVEALEGGCRILPGGGVARVSRIAVTASQNASHPNHATLRVTEIVKVKDEWGCPSSSAAGAIFTRDGVTKVKVESTPDAGADVRLFYEGHQGGEVIGKTSREFSVPFSRPSEAVLFYVLKPGYEPCAVKLTLNGKAEKVSCPLNASPK